MAEPEVNLSDMEKAITTYRQEGNSGQLARMLMDRQKTHGNFTLNAKISQEIKAAIGWGDVKGMSPVQRECCDMIALKLSRIASGRADFRDHWEDIIGYCNLALKECKS